MRIAKSANSGFNGFRGKACGASPQALLWVLTVALRGAETIPLTHSP